MVNMITIHWSGCTDTPCHNMIHIAIFVSQLDTIRNDRSNKLLIWATLHSCECLLKTMFWKKLKQTSNTLLVNFALLHYKWVDSKWFPKLGFDVVSTFNMIAQKMYHI